MAKLENTTDAAQVKQANFHQLFGDAPEMRDAASGETIRCFSGSRREPFHLFAVPREYPVCDFKNIPDILLKRHFTFSANPGEFFVFQIVLWTQEQGLGDIHLFCEAPPFPWR